MIYPPHLVFPIWGSSHQSSSVTILHTTMCNFTTLIGCSHLSHSATPLIRFSQLYNPQTAHICWTTNRRSKEKRLGFFAQSFCFYKWNKLRWFIKIPHLGRSSLTNLKVWIFLNFFQPPFLLLQL